MRELAQTVRLQQSGFDLPSWRSGFDQRKRPDLEIEGVDAEPEGVKVPFRLPVEHDDVGRVVADLGVDFVFPIGEVGLFLGFRAGLRMDDARVERGFVIGERVPENVKPFGLYREKTAWESMGSGKNGRISSGTKQASRGRKPVLASQGTA